MLGLTVWLGCLHAEIASGVFYGPILISGVCKYTDIQCKCGKNGQGNSTYSGSVGSVGGPNSE